MVIPHLTPLLQRAREFAVNAHGDQRYGAHPYAHHLDTVAHLLQPYGEPAQVIGFLHDVVEDTPVTLEHIRADFGDLVRDCVGLLTDEPGRDRAEKKERTQAKLADVDAHSPRHLALIVKAADRHANLRQSAAGVREGDAASPRKLERYRQEHPAFRAAVYREGLCENLWEEIEAIISTLAHET